MCAKVGPHLAQNEHWLLGTSSSHPFSAAWGTPLLHLLPTRALESNNMAGPSFLGTPTNPLSFKLLTPQSPRVLKAPLVFTLENESVLGKVGDFMGPNLPFRLSLGYPLVLLKGHIDPAQQQSKDQGKRTIRRLSSHHLALPCFQRENILCWKPVLWDCPTPHT